MTLKKLTEGKDITYGQLGILCVFAILLGLLVGGVDTLFGRVLLQLSDFREHYLFILVPFLPLAGLFIVWLYSQFAGKAAQGMGLIFKVGQEEEEDIPLRLVPLVTLSTWLTHLFGGSAGREGVAVQLGATLSFCFGRFLDIPHRSRYLVTIGMAAGFAGLFQTPIAATFFALEVLVLGQLNLSILLPTLVASLVASQTSHYLGLEKFSHIITSPLPMNLANVLKLAVLGLIFGLVGNFFASGLSWVKKRMTQVFTNPFWRIAIGGFILAILLLVLGQGRYTGLGTNLISSSFDGERIYLWDWLLKLALTLFTLSLGFQGGEVTPLFAIGASLGAVLAVFLGLPVTLVAALGYFSVFGSSTNTLLAPIFIGVEVFGPENTLSYMIVMSFAYVVNRKQTIYGQQKIQEI